MLRDISQPSKTVLRSSGVQRNLSARLCDFLGAS